MNPKKRRRFAFVIAILLTGAGGAGLVVMTLGKNVRYFYSPSDLAAEHVAPGVSIRVGGLVSKNSVRHDGGVSVHFAITDGSQIIHVAYTGVLPGLFREGQGVVAIGTLDQKGIFDASELLAKHDEKYMPPEVVDALRRSGQWKDGT